MVNIGKQIKALRKKTNISQGDLAKKANVSVSFISQLENQKYSDISTKVLVGFCKALNVKPTDLLKETESH